MMTLQVKTLILPGGRIEVQSPELPEGREATVQIVVGNDPPKRRFSEVLGDYPGGQLFRSVEEVDRYINEERDSWEK